MKQFAFFLIQFFLLGYIPVNVAKGRSSILFEELSLMRTQLADVVRTLIRD